MKVNNSSYYLCLFLIAISHLIQGQPISYNFHKLGFEQGLNDGIIRGIGQDKFGYIWVASVGALNRYDGKKFITYTHTPGDSTSPYSSQPRCIHSDKNGRLWIGFETGLMEYDYSKKQFRRIPQLSNLFISSLCSESNDVLYIGTNKGLYRFDVNTGKVFDYANSLIAKHSALNKNRIYHIKLKNNILYLGTGKGLVYFNIKNDEAQLEQNELLTNFPVTYLDVDKSGNVWLCSFAKIKLAKLHVRDKKVEIFDYVLDINKDEQPYHVPGCVIDSKDRLWVITTQVGLMEYDSINNSFIKHLHQENIPSSPIGNSYRCIFEDATGLIWLGFDVEGINYFNPDKNLFSTILPFPEKSNASLNRVGRAISTDDKGNIWMGNHDGLSMYNPVENTYKIFRNEIGKKQILYSNHIRSLLCDDENNVWIGTSTGVNKYNAKTKKIEFIDEKKLPLSFYNSINKDNSGNVWFCTNDSASLYWYSVKEKSFHNISTHPQLKKYKGFAPTSYVLEDSKNRIWISFARKGAVMFDKNSLQTKHFIATDSIGNNLIGNQVIDIKEDKKGVVWLATFNGITGIDIDKNSIHSLNIKNGLAGNMTGAIAIDNNDRIWAGVNGGLTMIDTDRKNIKTFTETDGISSTGFPEHAGLTGKNGHIMFPSNIGYISFDPGNYKTETYHYNFYISDCRILENKVINFNEEENIPELNLSYKETSFTFRFVALNYKNPGNTFYAYKLEGFENEWHYTSEPYAAFTNVPGGNYKFLLKSADNKFNWGKISAKQVNVNLATIFYKTTLFKIISVLSLFLLCYFFYNYRSKQQQQLYSLKNKAQSLEKEKATAMFENLKQQLNPHFLFNSLTSLSGLIEMDQASASRFLNQMSVIYRYILKNADAETVSLKEELDFVKMYVNLQKTRFSEGLEVNINVPAEFHHYKIAPVTLQNLIENAIKHNVIDKYRPLRIDIYIENRDYIVVENNLQKKVVVETSNQRGLKQFISLYRFLSHLPIIIENDNETMFKIKIPLI